ncbi:MAG TPA: ABC transporter permease [Rhizobiaceae bacterium]|nr:ABC transporter permease [Rhizobiaceae bacterium]
MTTSVSTDDTLPMCPDRFALGGTIARIGLPVLTIVLAMAAWEYAEIFFQIPSYLVPRPSEFLARFYSDFPELQRNFIATGQVIIWAFLIGGGVGVVLAYLIVTFRSLEGGAYRLIVFLQIVPKTITAPLFVTWFGVGIVPKLALTTFITFFPVLVDSMTGFRSIDPRLYHLSRSMGANWWQTFIHLQFPAALPHIFSGLKIATVYAVTAVIVVEFVGSSEGLGYMIVQALGMMDMSLMFAAILATSFLGLIFTLAVSSLEMVVMPWLRYKK